MHGPMNAKKKKSFGYTSSYKDCMNILPMLKILTVNLKLFANKKIYNNIGNLNNLKILHIYLRGSSSGELLLYINP